MKSPFTKMQAVGNDFVVVEEAAWPEGTNWAKQAVRLCDRKFGVGADGLLVVGPSRVADLRMRMFNPDGTEDMCGNGLRCVVRHAQEHDLFAGDEVRVETLDGVHTSGRSDTGAWSVCMGAPHFAPQMLPMRADGARVLDHPLDVAGERIAVSVVNTGSTHAVIFVDELPGDARFLALSPPVENHPLFPQRTSVIWTRVESAGEGDAAAVSVRIWERGVGETLGCGTGALAAAVAAIETGRVQGTSVRVRSRGGELTAAWGPGSPDCRLVLTGPAETVYRGSVDAE